MREARGRFFVKKLRKKLLQPLHGMFQRPPAPEQKFFAELFFKKATACWPFLAKH
jgi:hypothetical protein